MPIRHALEAFLSLVFHSLIERRETLIEAADLVTEMELIKHPFRSGIKAQIGVEF